LFSAKNGRRVRKSRRTIDSSVDRTTELNSLKATGYRFVDVRDDDTREFVQQQQNVNTKRVTDATLVHPSTFAQMPQYFLPQRTITLKLML